jgi:hypothetical protein
VTQSILLQPPRLALPTWNIARGTNWSITATIRKDLGDGSTPQPQNITTHHVMCTVRQMLIDGTVDSVSAPVWQGDVNGLPPLGGIVLKPQSGTTLGQCVITMPGSATQSLRNPTFGPLELFYDIVDNDQAGGIYQTETGIIVVGYRVGLTQP